MKHIIKLGAFCFLLSLLASCTKHDENLDRPLPLGLGGDTWAKGPIDKWLFDSLVAPYNIETKYRWDPWELNLDKTLVPPDENKVIPAMSAIRQVWINPYTAETGSEQFIKKYAPKEIILVGSAEYNPNNTIVLGQAEGGKKIVLFVINNFVKTNVPEVRRMLHTIEHEFAHILHQNIMYPQEFKTITPNYTSNWFNISDATAQTQGFATGYSESGPDDDFVEMVSTMLVEGKNRWEELVTAQSAASQSLLRRKEDIVVTYFRQAWNIDFYSLQKRIQDAINNLSPDPVDAYYGFGKTYTRVSVNPANTNLTQGSGFTTVFNSAKAGLATLNPIYVLDSMAVIFTAATTNTLRMYFHATTTGTNYQADYTYAYSKDASNNYTFTYVGVPATTAGSNGTFIKASVQPLLNYFSNNKFKIDWLNNPNNTRRTLRIIFTPDQTANGSFMGLLLP